jgi:hypothetical protein
VDHKIASMPFRRITSSSTNAGPLGTALKLRHIPNGQVEIVRKDRLTEICLFPHGADLFRSDGLRSRPFGTAEVTHEID